MNLETIINQIERLKNNLLDIRPGSNLEELIQKIEVLYETKIYIEPAALPNCISGFCSVVSTGHLIQYDQSLKGRERLIVIGHELAHIINGDVGCHTEKIEKEIKVCFRDSSVEGQLGEKKAELMGLYLITDLGLDEHEATCFQWYGIRK